MAIIKRIVRKIIYLNEFLNLPDFFLVACRTIFFEYSRLVLRKTFIKAKLFDFELYLSVKKEGIERMLAIRRKRELDQRYIIERLVKEGDVILDIGAHIGYYCLMEAMLTKKTGRIYAFEPDSRNFGFIKRNIALNKMQEVIFPYNLAVSDYNGEADFYVTEKTNLSTLSSSRFKFGSDPRKYEKIKIKVIDMGDFLAGIGQRVNLVRMDVEGHEVEILGSLLKLLKVNRGLAPGYVVFETHFVKYDEKRHDINMVLRGLFDMGYSINMISSFDERYAKFNELGYNSKSKVKEYPYLRRIYSDIGEEDAIKLIHSGSVRTVALRYKSDDHKS